MQSKDGHFRGELFTFSLFKDSPVTTHFSGFSFTMAQGVHVLRFLEYQTIDNSSLLSVLHLNLGLRRHTYNLDVDCLSGVRSKPQKDIFHLQHPQKPSDECCLFLFVLYFPPTQKKKHNKTQVLFPPQKKSHTLFNVSPPAGNSLPTSVISSVLPPPPLQTKNK